MKRGEKAITLCMPITCKWTEKAENSDSQDAEHSFTRFIYKRNWFVLSQTEGQEYVAPAIPNWEKEKALATLGITQETFQHPDGNALGYAKRGKVIAVSPLTRFPQKLFSMNLPTLYLATAKKIC